MKKLKCGKLIFNPETGEAKNDKFEKTLEIGNRDYEILKILMENHGKAVPYRNIIFASLKNPLEKLLFKNYNQEIFQKEKRKLIFIIAKMRARLPGLKIKNYKKIGYRICGKLPNFSDLSYLSAKQAYENGRQEERQKMVEEIEKEYNKIIKFRKKTTLESEKRFRNGMIFAIEELISRLTPQKEK